MARPLKYKDIQTVKDRIEWYFNDCDERKAPYTLIGLANALNVNRQTLYRYSNYKNVTSDDIENVESLTEKTKIELCHIITQAVDKIEQYTVEQLMDRDRYKGAQFLLACNYGYRQTQSIEIQSDKDINISISE